MYTLIRNFILRFIFYKFKILGVMTNVEASIEYFLVKTGYTFSNNIVVYVLKMYVCLLMVYSSS